MFKFYVIANVCGEYEIYIVYAKDAEEAEKKVQSEIPYATVENALFESELRKI